MKNVPVLTMQPTGPRLLLLKYFNSNNSLQTMTNFKHFTDKKNVLISPIFILLLTGCSKTENSSFTNQKRYVKHPI